jgi:hypothetical protein
MRTMARPMVPVTLAVILLFLGWVGGRAQTSARALELIVDTPEGIGSRCAFDILTVQKGGS